MSNEVFSRRSSVFFVCGGHAAAGGCTLEYLIDNGGFADFDKSLIMDENGDPIANGIHGYYDPVTGIIWAGGSSFNANMVGMICYIGDSGESSPPFTSPGRYEITAADSDSITIKEGLYGGVEADLGVYVGGSFDTISNALDNITANDAGGRNDCYLFTKENEVISARPQVAGGGNVQLNSKLFITGFNTTLLDMMPGGAYYQSAYDAWINGIDADCHVEIDLDDINSFVFTCNNVIVQNLRITNHSDGYVIEIANDIRNIVFINCIADDGYNVISFTGDNVNIAFISCYIFDSELDMIDANTLGNYIFFIDCVLNSGANPSNQLIRMFWPGLCVVTGCIIITKAFCFLNKGDFLEWNNTIIASSSPVHFCHTTYSTHIGFKDIVILPQDGKFIHMGNLGGSSLLQQGHCLIGDDGEPFAGTYATNDESGGQISIKNMFSLLEIDPELDGNFRPRNPQVLRGGIPQLSDGLSQLGAVRQKYQFPQKGRIVNHGRAGIVK